MKLKVVPEPSERWTTAIACVGSLTLGIELLDRRVVPVLDLAEEDLGERRAVEHELARLDAVEVDDRHDAAHHRRELDEAVLVELLALQRRVGGAEGHGLGLDLLDAAARADRLIVQADAGLLLIGVRPLGVDRIGEGGAGAGDVGRGSRWRRGRGEEAGRGQGLEEVSCSLLLCRRMRQRRTGSRPRLDRVLWWLGCWRSIATRSRNSG